LEDRQLKEGEKQLELIRVELGTNKGETDLSVLATLLVGKYADHMPQHRRKPAIHTEMKQILKT
jgi:hypothetical protein